MVGGEALGTVWRWIKSHKAAAALIVVLLTLVPVLPEYQIVDFAGRDGDAITKLLCSKLPADGCHRGPCSPAIEEQIELWLKVFFPEKRALIPGLFLRRRKAFRFDYAEWKEDYTRLYRAYESTWRSVQKAHPLYSPPRTKVVRAACPAEPNWAEILKLVPLDELQRLTQEHRDEIKKSSDEFLKKLERQEALRAK